MALTAKDGAKFERTISLVGDGIRFEMALKAEESRPFNFLVHPEYDAGHCLISRCQICVPPKANLLLKR